jgi:hypothetical protein
MGKASISGDLKERKNVNTSDIVSMGKNKYSFHKRLWTFCKRLMLPFATMKTAT